MDDAPRRTVKIKLDVPEERRGDFHQTKTQFLHCANRTSEWAWRYDDYCITSKSKAENALQRVARGNRPHCQPRPERHPTRHRSRHKRRREAEAGQEDESTRVRRMGASSTTNAPQRSTTTMPRSLLRTAESLSNTSSRPGGARGDASDGTTGAMTGMRRVLRSNTTSRTTRSTCTSR